MITTRPPEVVLLDLRGDRPPELTDLAGPVVVIDDAAALLQHEELYFRLVDDRQVHGLICVVIGQSGAGADQDGAVLAMPRVLPQGASAILWVGDEHGVLWSPETERPHPAARERPSAAQRLIDVLRVPEVFEQVGVVVGGFPDRTASPGHRLVSGAAEPGELAEARTTVLRRLSEYLPGVPPPTSLARPTEFAAEPEAAFVPDKAPRVGAALARAVEAIKAAEDQARVMPGPHGVFGRARPGEVLAGLLAEAGRATEEYRHALLEMLNAVDGHLRVGRPDVRDVADLGAPPPTPVRQDQIASAVQGLVRETLRTRPSLPTLAAQLRQAAANAEPQGCAGAVNELRERGVIERSASVFRRWPLWLSLFPLVLLTSFTAAAAPPSPWVGYPLGATFALTWFLAGWLLLARRPGGGGELGWVDALWPALAGYALPAVVGAGGGIALANYARSVLPVAIWLPPRYVWWAIAIAAVLTVGFIVAAWPTAVRRWVAAMSLPALRTDIAEMTATADWAITHEWRPAARRRAVAEAFVEVANGLDDISEVYSDALRDRARAVAGNGVGRRGLHQVLRPELLEVIGTDLLALTLDLLSPAWSAISRGIRRHAGSYIESAQQRLAGYHAHLTDPGLLTTPAFVTDNGPRDRLVARQWEASEALEAMRARLTDEMIQLCRSTQLAVIDREVGGRLLRLAPRPVRVVLEADQVRNRGVLDDRPIWTSRGDCAGSLRLLPLRWGAVQQRAGTGT